MTTIKSYLSKSFWSLSLKIRKLRSKSSTEVEDFDITSLLDILVILLVFLLKSFNDSDLSVDLVNELALPYSLIQGSAHDGPVVQVNSRKNVYFDSTLIGNLKNSSTLSSLNEKLENRFKKNSKKDLKTSSKMINLIFDKKLIYQEINTILETASNAGYTEYKFIIQGEQ